MTIAKLSPAERRAILHRLEVPDAIAEALAECESEAIAREAGTYSDEFRRAAVNVAGRIERGAINIAALSDLERAVLKDAIEGSTYVGQFDPAWDKPQRIAAASRTLRSAADKLTAAGLKIEYVPEG